VFGFSSVNREAAIHSHYMDSQTDYFLKIVMCVYLKKESHVQQGWHKGD